MEVGYEATFTRQHSKTTANIEEEKNGKATHEMIIKKAFANVDITPQKKNSQTNK